MLNFRTNTGNDYPINFNFNKFNTKMVKLLVYLIDSKFYHKIKVYFT